MDDFFAELEAEISKITTLDKLRKDRDQAKKRANTTALSSQARARAVDDYRELSKLLEAHEWRKISSIALFAEQTCDGCGSVHQMFLQFMELQHQVKHSSTQRWVRVARPEPGLPREVLLQPTTTHICADCCSEHGFVPQSAGRLAHRKDPIGLSPTYEQEDINAPSQTH